ncbi:hypothetical protein TSAR_002829 [Trichomalopsis sarcophagae]|uniref:Uncharacterized protein n=1 Tax=Trichomalopsis sarcophagae TaxID=543379 RepID=A0A232EZ35_9HYME|nr:hypothetical protein TSAR_002829 [Trichomalopsis sarcophagae]
MKRCKPTQTSFSDSSLITAAKMKMSFSLSSLQPSSGSLERAEHARIRADRPYNSLTKKRSNISIETLRRGSNI